MAKEKWGLARRGSMGKRSKGLVGKRLIDDRLLAFPFAAKDI